MGFFFSFYFWFTSISCGHKYKDSLKTMSKIYVFLLDYKSSEFWLWTFEKYKKKKKKRVAPNPTTEKKVTIGL